MKNRKITLGTKLKPAEIFSLVTVILAAAVIGMILSSQVFTIAGVRNVSMQDTLYEGDRLFVNKLAYRFSEPDRGDVVIFLKGQDLNGFFGRCRISIQDILHSFSKEPRGNRLVKRIIALPGEKIEVRDGNVYINGEMLHEDYVKNTTLPGYLPGEYVVPEEMYIVMGDNRIFSGDSREFGPVSINSIEGKASHLIMPMSKWKSLDIEYE